jgi:cytoskeleton protein RodZ
MADSEQSSAAPAAAPTSKNLGELLRSARVAHGLTVEQIATELRIEAPHLAALEDNQFERIGIPVFVKGYLRQYGQRLGVDSRELLALYAKQARLEEVRIQPSPTIHLRDERQITVWVVALIVIAAIVAALAMWWTSGAPFDFSFSTAAVTPAAAPAVAVAGPAAASRQPAAAAVVAAPVEANVAAAEPAVVPIAVEAVAAVPAGEASEPAVPAAFSAPATLPLELVFDQDSWAEITDARGERLYNGPGKAQQRTAMRGEPPFAVAIGNAGVVRLVVDGYPYPIPTEGRQGDIARFSVEISEE